MKEVDYTLKDSVEIVKELFKDKKLKRGRDSLKVGSVFFASYDALDKKNYFDKRPFILLLRQNGSHILGLNFHYLPSSMRTRLIKIILSFNKKNIKNKRPLDFSYKDFKSFFRTFGYAPCIRLYIRKRMSPIVVKIEPENFLKVSKLNTAMFTNGVKSETIYKMILKKSRLNKNK